VVGTVHSGPRAALPHGSPIERKPQIGEPMIAGIGASVGGYHAESGATFVIGEPKGDVMRCLQAAMECDAAAVKALRVGNTCTQVNEAALGVLREYGLGDAIRHRIGHGMGLQGHEGPWLAPGDHTPLVAGMVFSNEPGIYRPGIDGYRIIDSMIVTEGEAKVTSRFLANHPPEKRIIQI
jgi:Xaa-Pro dipeptidase